MVSDFGTCYGESPPNYSLPVQAASHSLWQLLNTRISFGYFNLDNYTREKKGGKCFQKCSKEDCGKGGGRKGSPSPSSLFYWIPGDQCPGLGHDVTLTSPVSIILKLGDRIQTIFLRPTTLASYSHPSTLALSTPPPSRSFCLPSRPLHISFYSPAKFWALQMPSQFDSMNGGQIIRHDSGEREGGSVI